MKAERVVVHYKRVSTDRGHTDAQDAALSAYAAAHPEDHARVIEGVESGRRMDGPRFTELWNLVESGRVRKIVVYDYHRIGRNVLRSLEFVKLCKEQDTEIISVVEPLDITTPEGWQRLMHKLTDAEFELRRLSRETARGLASAKARGTFTGGSQGKWLRKETYQKIAECLRLRDAGTPIRKIAAYLKMSDKTVQKIIKHKDDLPDTRKRVWDAPRVAAK